MANGAKVFGHPVHQMLIVFPLGLMATAMIFDVIHFVTGTVTWLEVGWYMIGAGIIGGLVAAVFGLVDWLALSGGTRAKRIGAWHGIGNVVVVVLFAASWAFRKGDPHAPPVIAFVCSFAGAALAVVTGWLGGELVDRLGVGVDEGANVNARSSLDGPVRPPVT